MRLIARWVIVTDITVMSDQLAGTALRKQDNRVWRIVWIENRAARLDQATENIAASSLFHSYINILNSGVGRFVERFIARVLLRAMSAFHPRLR